jgi:hypothetical protein
LLEMARDASCETLKMNLERIYTRLRWLLLNVGTMVPDGSNNVARDDLELMLNGDPSTPRGKPAVITFEGNYYLTDRITQ